MTYTASKQELLNTISSKLNEATYRIGSEMSNFFTPIDIELDVLSTSIASDLTTEEQKNLLFHRLLKSRPEIEEVSYIDHIGREKNRYSRINGFGSGDMRSFKINELVSDALINHGRKSEIKFSKYAEPQIHITTLVGNMALGTHGILLTVVNLKWLWDTVQYQKIGLTGYNYVVNNLFTLVAHRDPSLVLSKLKMQASTIPTSLFQKQGQRSLKVYTNFEGNQVAGVSVYDKEHRWWIVVEQPVEEGLAPLNRVINRFVLAFLLAGLVTIIVVVFFSRLTMRPLENISLGITRLAQGDRGVRVDLNDYGSSELASISRGFNQMASKLDTKIEGLLVSKEKLRLSQKNLKDKEYSLEKAQEIAHVGSWDRNFKTNKWIWSPETFRIFGLKPHSEHPSMALLRELISKQDRMRVLNIIEQAISNKRPFECEYLICTRQGESRAVHEQAEISLDDQGNAYRMVGSIRDITERYYYIEELEYQSTHDSLTQLPNRLLLQRNLTSLISEYINNQQMFALILFDLDRFKEVNDSLGHKAGDNLLKQIGPRILPTLSKDDTLSRLGGDEFAILLTHISGQDEIIRKTEHLHQILIKEFDLENIRVQIGASIGIAICPEHCQDSSTLLRFADVAMYHAKQTGKKYCVYDSKLDHHNPRKLALMGGLREAIQNNDLCLYYQPKVDAKTNKVMAVEALVRWQHKDYGLLLPEHFISNSELSELIQPLTMWVLNCAITECKKWHKLGFMITVAINISVRNLQDRDFTDNIQQILSEKNFDPRFLQLEITESAIMTDPVRASTVIQELANMTLNLAIDDFGTGYSSLSYLKQIPVNELKIDKSFVLGMQNNENDDVIVKSTIDLAHNLGLKVTAEGVEDILTSKKLSQYGCDFMQGFYFSEPICGVDFRQWLNKRNDSQKVTTHPSCTKYALSAISVE